MRSKIFRAGPELFQNGSKVCKARKEDVELRDCEWWAGGLAYKCLRHEFLTASLNHDAVILAQSATYHVYVCSLFEKHITSGTSPIAGMVGPNTRVDDSKAHSVK